MGTWRSSARIRAQLKCKCRAARAGGTCQPTQCRDPWRFCQFLLEQCLKRGVHLHQPARAISVSKDKNGELNSIRIWKDGAETERMAILLTFAVYCLLLVVPCVRLVITAGAWSPRMFSTLFPKATTRIPVASLAGHALLLKNPFFDKDAEELCHAVFATDDNLGFSPEYFSRTGGEVYLAGLNSTQITLPETATDAQVNPAAVQQMKDCAKAMMGTVDGKDIEVLRQSLVRSLPLLLCHHQLTHNAVFSPCDVQRSTNRNPYSRRKARWKLQDSRWCKWGSVHCCRAWCLGYIAECRYRSLSNGASRG